MSSSSQPDSDRRRAIISDVRVQGVRVNERGNWLFVSVETRAGHVGLGELSHGGDDAQVARIVAHKLKPRLVGRELGAVAPLAHELRAALVKQGAPDRVVATALSGVEQALWDVAARTLGVSAHELLGGALRSSVRLYANINRALRERTPGAFASAARSAVGDGFSALKIAPFDAVSWRTGDPRALRKAISDGVERVAAVRAAVGPELALMVDCHGRFQRELAIQVARELEPFALFWLEDLVWADEDPEGLAAIGAAIRQPMAAGERELTLEAFFPIVSRRLAATVMPDVKHCGGLGVARQVAALAEAGRQWVSPHNPAGPVATLASAHLAATLSNFSHLEYAWGEVAFRAELLDPPERIADGELVLPPGPGLGARLNPDVLAEHSFDPLAE